MDRKGGRKLPQAVTHPLRLGPGVGPLLLGLSLGECVRVGSWGAGALASVRLGQGASHGLTVECAASLGGWCPCTLRGSSHGRLLVLGEGANLSGFRPWWGHLDRVCAFVHRVLYLVFASSPVVITSIITIIIMCLSGCSCC